MKLFQPIQGSIESKETQENLIDRGQLQVNVTSSVNAFPVKEARISISYTGIPESILEQVVTDSSGQTELVELNAPPEEWSLDENEERQPYSEYTLNIEAEGFESISVSGTEILANTKAIQNIRMKQKDQSREEEQVFVIPAHTLYGNYPPKIAEEEIKPVNETGEIVLSRVVVPEYIIVHDGSPRLFQRTAAPPHDRKHPLIPGTPRVFRRFQASPPYGSPDPDRRRALRSSDTDTGGSASSSAKTARQPPAC